MEQVATWTPLNAEIGSETHCRGTKDTRGGNRGRKGEQEEVLQARQVDKSVSTIYESLLAQLWRTSDVTVDAKPG